MGGAAGRRGGGAADARVDYIHRGRWNARLLDLRLGGKGRLTPLYFPSVSSSAQRSSVGGMIDFCTGAGAPQMLVSAYDMGRGRAPEAAARLKEYTEGGVLLLDSGAFEAHYAGRKWGFGGYAETVKATPCDIYASYDEMPKSRQSDGDALDAARRSAGRSVGVKRTAQCMVVLHGGPGGQLARVAERITQDGGGPRMYAVPEREMGGSIAEKIGAAARIRRALSATDPRNVLHVLGCGDPVVMALLACAGVDSFDSVDWSRWAMDTETLEWACADRLEFMGCECAACARDGTDTLARMWGHNLLFYEGFTERLREAILGDRDFGSLGAALGGRMAEAAREALGKG